MSEQLKEALSAAMDNEADAFELRRVLDESCADPELREQWHRMHLARAAMQDERFFDGRDLRQRIWAEMEGLEETPETASIDTEAETPTAGKSNWLGRVTGSVVAIAAAVLVVVNADFFVPGDAEPSLEVANIDNTVAAPITPILYPEATQEDRLRLDARRMYHYQQNALNKAGAVSFIRMATFKQTPPQDRAERAR
ncbi:MAG: sigma-E factor negative regulatory protein [Pseudomonadales bacterium]